MESRRIGLIGFSRAGFNTLNEITHPGATPFAAAVIDDAFSGSYVEYLTYGAVSHSQGAEFEQLFVGSFWENQTNWLRHSPTFNAHRVETPALITFRGETQGPLYAIDTLGAFFLNARPVEAITFPNAGHSLVLPRQRLASITATVDWMSLWLQGYEDPAPEKAEQYARWREMRDANEQRREREPN